MSEKILDEKTEERAERVSSMAKDSNFALGSDLARIADAAGKVYKFRSMYADAEARGAQWAAGDDPRITPLGKKLRKTRLDEIPRFWNVIKGDIPLRILKMRPEFSEEFMGAFALPAKSSTNRGKAFSQVVSCFANGLRMRRISLLNCNCIGGMETQFLAKPVFGVSPVHPGTLFQKSNNGLAKAAW